MSNDNEPTRPSPSPVSYTYQQGDLTPPTMQDVDPITKPSDFYVVEDSVGYQFQGSQKHDTTAITTTTTQISHLQNPTDHDPSPAFDQDQQDCRRMPLAMQDILSTDLTTDSNEFCGKESREGYQWAWEGNAHYGSVCLPSPETKAARSEEAKSHYYPIRGEAAELEGARQHYLPASTASTTSPGSAVQTLTDTAPPIYRTAVSFADPLVTRIYTEGLSRQSSYRRESDHEDEKSLDGEDKLSLDLETTGDVERGVFLSATDRKSRRPSYVCKPCPCRRLIRVHKLMANIMPLLIIAVYLWMYFMLDLVGRKKALDLSMVMMMMMTLWYLFYLGSFSLLSRKYECRCECDFILVDYHSSPDPDPVRLAPYMVATLVTLIPIMIIALEAQSYFFNVAFLFHGVTIAVFMHAWRLRLGCPEK